MFGFWIFMLIMDLLIPVTMIVIGWLFIKTPPENINMVSGYRTSMSMKSKDAWLFAHNYIGKLWRFIGLTMLVPTVIAMILILGNSIGVIGIFGGAVCLVQVVFMIIPIIFTEKALRENFDTNGNRRK